VTPADLDSHWPAIRQALLDDDWKRAGSLLEAVPEGMRGIIEAMAHVQLDRLYGGPVGRL